MAPTHAHAPLEDRARLKERDENVRFKQSMTPHVSREGLVHWKLEANGKCKQTYSWTGWFCLWVWELWRSSYRAPSDRTHTGTPRGAYLPCHSPEALAPIRAFASEAAAARAIPAHHQPVAVMLDLMNPQWAGRWPLTAGSTGP